MLNLDAFDWTKAGSDSLLADNHVLGVAGLLFDKIEDDVIAKQLQKLADKKKAVELGEQPVKPLKPEITIDDFGKIDIRIGTVLKAERMEKSKKLLKLSIDTGIDTRTVLSGRAEHYSPEEVVGKQVTLLVNLAPRKMMGIESQGMILMAEDKDGKLKLIAPGDVVSPGSTVA